MAGLSDLDAQAKSNALVAYVLMALGLFTVITWFAGGIWAIVKKSDARGSRFEDHYSNIISTFWWGIFWTTVGVLTLAFFVGLPILIIAGIWVIYRLVKGLANLTSDRSYSA
ncbi:hypothetical protein IB286_13310 [Spongiibacter sp. KMU-158]|uniref:Transmembrane protein n=1 Tax=Spongiibacter pelagi TaxID=2760804 RepID=A0A927GWP9_9GAMM|nr:hypothetical protein [Spongiibacter pelagi]